MAGVQVSATRPTPGETLSELPCPATGRDDDSSQHCKRLPDCWDEASAQVLALVGAREGEAPVYAQTVTEADGSFVLDGLPEGDFTLWALGEQGAELRSEVTAGAQDVQLVLNEGLTLTGIVVDEGDQPLPGVSLTILHEQHTRFFDTRSGADGRFRVGPLPKGNYGLAAASEGWLPKFMDHEDLERHRGKVRLVHPSRLMGRVSLEGTPVPGVEVSVKARQCQHFTEQVLKTNAEGRFALKNVGPCTYEFTAARDGLYAARLIDLDPLTEPPSEVLLSLGEGCLAEGTVRDEARSPVAGATVIIRSIENVLYSWKTTTDAEGHYRLGPVQASLYELNASAPGYVGIQYQEHPFARDTGPVDLSLLSALPITGVVVDDEGHPVPKVWLRLMPPEEPPKELAPADDVGPADKPQFMLETRRTDKTVSDAEGRFELEAPKAGPWSIRAMDDGIVSQHPAVRAPAEGIRIVLNRGATVMGTVTDELGAPVEGATVELWHAESELEEGSVRSSHTDAQGHFTLRRAPAGRFVVEATLDRDGVESAASKALELHDTDQAEVALRFEAGRSVSGIAVDGSGQPLADVILHVELPQEAVPRWRPSWVSVSYGASRNGEVITGLDGRFTLKHLVASAYELEARKAGYSFVPAKALGGELTSDGTLLVREQASEMRLVLERKGRILGRLIGPDGAPLRYFRVNGDSRNSPGGTFEVPFEESGLKHVEFAARGMASVRRSVEVQEGVDVNLGDVRMGAGRRVQGRVLDAETGEPIVKASIQIIDPSRGPAPRSGISGTFALTGEGGTFELPHVEERPLTLVVQEENHVEGQLLLGTGDESLTVRLSSGAQIEASVRDHEGKPLDAPVMLQQEDGTGWKVISVNGDTAVSGGVAPGLYLARVMSADSLDGKVFLPQHVRIPASGRVALSFVERREGATLVLRVEEPRADVGVVLLAGGLEPPPVSKETLERWAAIGRISEQQGPEKKFPYLPAGHATALLVLTTRPPQFHVEELEIPAEGVVEQVVHPRWQPLPEK